MRPIPLMAILGLLAISVSSCRIDKVTDKPNILFIAVDDLRPELSCFGESHIRSPNIDIIASEGLTFQNAYCNVPVCGASRASLLTGIRPTRNRFLNYLTWVDEEAPDVVTLPRHFRDHGYYTISNGKVFHHQYDSKDSWDENWRPEKLKVTWSNYQLEENNRIDSIPGQRGAPWECVDGPDNMYYDGQIAVKSIEDLKKLKSLDKPFFLATGFLKPHLAFLAPKKYWDLYDRDEIIIPDNDTLPSDVPGNLITTWGELRQYYGIPKEGPVSDSTAKTLVHGYYACVSYIDEQIGKILHALNELKLERNTIIILWGDHGWNLNEHGLWCKHSNFDTSTRSTLLLKVPGVTRGKETKSLVEFIDIYPTLTELCGLPLPDHLEGKSMVPLIEYPDIPIKDFIITKWKPGLTIKTPDFAYTEWTNATDSIIGTMLYDHRSDRDEIYNLAARPEYKDIIDSLSNVMNTNKGKDYYN